MRFHAESVSRKVESYRFQAESMGFQAESMGFYVESMGFQTEFISRNATVESHSSEFKLQFEETQRSAN